MLVISPDITVVQIEDIDQKVKTAKKIKTKCCKKYKKDNRCKLCPCFDLQ